jgi:hypothetical protein
MLLASLSNSYSGRMRRSGVALLGSIILGAIASHTFSTEPNWACEYTDKQFLNGQAVFQMSIEQSGNDIQVSRSPREPIDKMPVGPHSQDGCAPMLLHHGAKTPDHFLQATGNLA